AAPGGGAPGRCGEHLGRRPGDDGCAARLVWNTRRRRSGGLGFGVSDPVLYAIPADAPGRFAERLSPILSHPAAIDAWWRAQDPSRTLRFDLLPLACDWSIGRVDLTDLRVPGDATGYADGDNGFRRLTDDLARDPLSFRSSEKKYLVYYDGPRDGQHASASRRTARPALP